VKRKKPRFKNPYKLENELCDVLIKYARANGWKIYPETSGWDVLIVKDIQIGIQAKLKDNIDVLAQAIEGKQSAGVNPKWANPAPNIRAVLVPRASREFKNVANALGVFVIEGLVKKRDSAGRKYWSKEISDLDKYKKKHLTSPIKLCWIPDVEINVPAGVKSPKSITEWKIKAVKLCFKLNKKGYLTSKDFTEAKLSITIWKIKWLIDSGKKDGKLTKYVKKTNAVLPDGLYPEITEAFNRDC